MRHTTVPAHWFAGLLVGSAALAQVPIPDVAALLPAGAQPGELAGWALEVDGGSLVMGAYSWSEPVPVTVFVRGAAGWVEQKSLPQNGATHAYGCGVAVAIEGDTLVVGAPLEDLGGGAFYTYDRVGGEWVQRERTTLPGSHGEGAAVALEGGWLFLGTSSEEVVVLRRAGTGWAVVQTVTAPTPTPGERFGSALVVDGDQLLVGAPYCDDGATDAGRAFLFERVAGVFAPVAWLGPQPALGGGLFGASLAIDGDTLAIGAHGWNWPPPGSVHVYTRVTGTWRLEQRIETPGGATNDGFGSGLALAREQLVVGAFGARGGRGEAHLYQRDAGAWTRTSVFVPQVLDGDARFGMRAAFADGEVVVTAPYDAPAGRAFVFPLAPRETWSYCRAAPNATGAPTRIGALGAPGLAAGDLVLHVAAAPPAVPALFLCGVAPAELPLGAGWLCVSPFAPGLLRLGPPTWTDAAGTALCAVDAAALPPGHAVVAGDTRYFQCWHRDPGGVGSALSDGLAVRWAP